LKETTDIIVTCDHGFDYEPASDLLAPVRADVAGNDVVVDNEGAGRSFTSRITIRKRSSSWQNASRGATRPM
jgi:hypothetical protein